MTGAEIKAIRRRELGLSVEQFAQLVNVQAGRTVRRWEDNSRDIPGPVLVILQIMADFPQVRRHLLASARAASNLPMYQCANLSAQRSLAMSRRQRRGQP